jgi:peroxiredoxin
MNRFRTCLTVCSQLLICALLSAAPARATVTPQTLAPDFTLRLAPGSGGGNLRLQEQRGQVVLLNFWASWCGPCKQELPHLNRLFEKYGPAGFVLLGVNIDDDPRSAQAVATRLGLKFPLLLDVDKNVSRLYDMGSMPATVLIDRDGRVRFLHKGYREGMEADYERQIRELVKE